MICSSYGKPDSERNAHDRNQTTGLHQSPLKQGWNVHQRLMKDLLEEACLALEMQQVQIAAPTKVVAECSPNMYGLTRA